MSKEKLVLPVAVLKEFLHYDSLTGDFTWIKSTAHCVKVGDTAGSKDRNGYIQIRINSIRYFAHRLAWLYMKGEMSDKFIDHKNGNPSDNRFCNLREVTHRQNMQNRTKPHSNNKSGFLGVYFNEVTGNYKAEIKINGKKKCLGYFDLAKDASKAYLAAKRKLHPYGTI